QQDAAGLSLFGAKPGFVLPPRCRTSHLRQMIQVMTANPPTGETNVAASLRAMVRNLKRRGLIVLISDLIDDPADTLKSIRLLGSHQGAPHSSKLPDHCTRTTFVRFAFCVVAGEDARRSAG